MQSAEKRMRLKCNSPILGVCSICALVHTYITFVFHFQSNRQTVSSQYHKTKNGLTKNPHSPQTLFLLRRTSVPTSLISLPLGKIRNLTNQEIPPSR